MTRRVVVTGLGVVSSLGNNKKEVQDSLYHARSGITFQPDYAAMGLRSHVAGSIKNLNFEELIDRKLFRFMAKGHAYAWLAMQEAIADSALPEAMVSNIRTGLIVGAGGASHESILEGIDTIREKGIRRVGPYMVTKAMASGVSACLATGAKIKGVNYAITSACSTSAHCIGAGVEQIQLGKQDIIFAGGAEEEHWTLSFMFDGMGALSSKYNETPEKASRTYDVNRDGFVISGGGGILVLEEYEHAKARGAKIYAEVVGYGATADAYHMTAPHPEGLGAANVMRVALADAGIQPSEIDYINVHGTSTPLGDPQEIKAIQTVFGEDAYKLNISSTKSMTGHLLGGAGAIEAIACILAITKGIIPPTINHFADDPAFDPKLNLTFNKAQHREVKYALSNTFGFGGHNASVILKKFEE